jgi:O-antigen chain-terminating methyltransferase
MHDSNFDSNIPEIDIDKLMENIRKEISKRRQQTDSPVIQNKKEPVKASASEEPTVDVSAIRSILSSAEARADVGTEVTPMYQFRGVTRKIALSAGKFIVYLASFITDKQRSFNNTVIHALRTITDNLDRVVNKIVTEKHNETKYEITRLRGDVNALHSIQAEMKTNRDTIIFLESVLKERESRIRDLEETFKEIKNNKEEITRLRGELNSLRGIQAEMKTNRDTITYLESILKERESRIRDLEHTIKDIKTSFLLREKNLKNRDIQIKDLKKALIDLKSLQGLQEGNIKHQITHIVELEKYITHLFDRLVTRERDNIPDNWYVSFENKFRGTREEIMERLKIYLPYIKDVDAGSGEYPVLDLGCGRGEWLELLRENGLKGAGVDNNRMMLSICQEKRLDVIEHDCVKFLSKQKSDSIAAITAFHLLEHLHLDILIQLLSETVRVLKPGGVAIFETPNPQNILVGSYSFYMDPTHKKPLPSPMLKFLAEKCEK